MPTWLTETESKPGETSSEVRSTMVEVTAKRSYNGGYQRIQGGREREGEGGDRNERETQPRASLKMKPSRAPSVRGVIELY